MMTTTTWLRPEVTLLGRSWQTFRLCGVTGLTLGTVLAMSLARHAALSLLVVALCLGVGVLTFFVLTMATKVITGVETLIYYHHEIAILATTAAMLAWLGLPVLAYLDVTSLGLGVFLACGRCGCLMVGCCHGVPSRWGVRYGPDHAEAGFPACYVGVRLFPIQGLESAVVWLTVAGASSLHALGFPAGTAMSTYVICYATARIWLEELRGDRGRPYWRRLSEAQWTSLLVIIATLLAERQGRVPFSAWHLAMGITAALSLIAIAQSRQAEREVLLPDHASEIAEIVRPLRPHAPHLADAETAEPAESAGPVESADVFAHPGVLVRRTSLTVGVSTQAIGPSRPSRPDAVLFSLSRADRDLTLPEARALSRFIAHLTARPDARHHLMCGRRHIFHLILGEPADSP